MMTREVLSNEHKELAGMAAELAQLAARPVADGVRIAQVRWTMSRLLATHLAKEDRLLYPRLRGSDDAQVSATANRFAHELGGLAACWRSYITNWSGDRIRGEWPAFAAETKAVMHALAHRIEKEEGELYPLLDHA